MEAYRGALELLALGRPHVPSWDDPWVQEQIALLREHLPAENDEFLLCYGLTVPGLVRRIDPPLLALARGFPRARQLQAVEQIRLLRAALAEAGLTGDTSSALAELALRVL